MTDDELIAKAKEHVRHLEKMSPELEDECFTLDELPTIQTKEALFVSFSTSDGKEGIRIILDRETGKWLEFIHAPRERKQKD